MSLPPRDIDEHTLAVYPRATTFVVYCAGAPCNRSGQGCGQVARLGRPVKKMIGGIEEWRDEGFNLARA